MEPSDNTQNPLTWNIMAAPLPSPSSKQSAQVDLLPRHTTMPINFGSHQLVPLGGRNFSEGMVQASAPVTSEAYPLSFANKQSIQMAVPPKGRQIPFSVYPGSQQFQLTNKFPSEMESLPGIQNQASVDVGTHFSPAPNKRSVQMVSLPKFQTTLPITVGSQQLSSKRPAQMEAPVKVQAEFESVRSKLRESLAAALDTVSKVLNKPKVSENSSINEEKSLPLKNLTSNNEANKRDEGHRLDTDVCSLGNMSDMKEADKCDVSDGQLKHVNLEDDTSVSHYSIMEDELLQGHGLCWASDLDSENADAMLKIDAKRPKMTPVKENDRSDTSSQLPENLAIKIEAELFKLFGGVNKKYKEKGRSLLFNLKDPSNPDLREGVLSGNISPEKLCSMTAEELASKELSQWRQAKAVELAQMVVLPDTDIDIRRLVKKTHKGEFQVEVEQDDGAHVEVGLGSDVLSKMPKANENAPTQSRFSEKGGTLWQGEQSVSDRRDLSGSLDSLLPEKTDYLQDLIVDELRGTELLPPVVSLDEFMKALDSEPPFENLEVSAFQDNSNSAERNLDILEPENPCASDSSGEKSDSTSVASGSKLASESSSVSKLHSANINAEESNETSAPNADKVESKYGKSADEPKADSSGVKPVPDTSKSKNMWDGLLQLNVSALSTVVSSFISGEKTSMQEWPNLLEVKGRVRLGAFEKFLLELPLSRSRAIMVVEFRWKEDSPESGRLHLTESINSYITDERLGYVEPAPGVELYLCPPHPRITDIIAKHLSKDHTENIQSITNNLIGIVVWRRPHVSISPRISSHRKHSSLKKQHSSSRKHHSNPNPRASIPQPHPDDEDDVPPGFGPLSIARDEDDLPEFDFTRGGGSRLPTTTTSSLRSPTASGNAPTASVWPEDHMRELIQKYGQGKNNAGDLRIPIQPWNDDDDIPEWQPQSQSSPMPPPSQVLGYHQPLLVSPHMHPQQPQMISPNLQFFQPAPPPSVADWWPVARGPPPINSMPQPCNFFGQPSGGQLPGVMPGMVPGFGGLPGGVGACRPDNSGSSRGG